MGTIRILLAVSVLFSHFDSWNGTPVLVGGPLAVKLFFIISGFYMGLILHERYTGPGTTRTFLINRALRLLPAYYVVLLVPLLAVLVARICGNPDSTFGSLAYWQLNAGQLKPGIEATLAFLNVSVLGQEWTYLGWETPAWLQQTLYLPSTELPHAVPAFFYLINPPVWSLGVELGFYLLAPCLVRRSWPVLLALVAGFVGFRALAGPWAGPTADFWLNHSLPGTLGYFLLGAVAYRAYARLRQTGARETLEAMGSYLLPLVITLLFASPWLSGAVREPLLVAALTTSLPFIFARTAGWKSDRLIGELSYPVYILHWNIFICWYALRHKLHVEGMGRGVETALVFLSIVAVAYALHRLIESPIERIRRRLMPVPAVAI